MQHSKKNRTLSRPKRQRTALLRALAISLIKNGKIQTTAAKAKELQPFAEKLITYGKTNTVSSRRIASSKLGEPKSSTIKKLFDEIGPNYKDRDGGYTRVIKMGRTDAGREEAVIELV